MESKSESGNSSLVDHEGESRRSREPLRILMLAANPIDRYRLALTDEYRLLRGMVYPNSEAGACDLHVEWAARPEDLHRALVEFKPHIVHFSGHANNEVICLEDDERKSRALSKMELGLLFSHTRSWLRVVVLNGCHSAPQAGSLIELVDFIVGTNIPVPDQIALQFTSDFYRAIAKGGTVREAFKKAQKNTPPGAYELIVRPGADETTSLLPPTDSSEITFEASESLKANKVRLAEEILEGQDAFFNDRGGSPNQKSTVNVRTKIAELGEFDIARRIIKQGKN